MTITTELRGHAHRHKISAALSLVNRMVRSRISLSPGPMGTIFTLGGGRPGPPLQPAARRYMSEWRHISPRLQDVWV